MVIGRPWLGLGRGHRLRAAGPAESQRLVPSEPGRSKGGGGRPQWSTRSIQYRLGGAWPSRRPTSRKPAPRTAGGLAAGGRTQAPMRRLRSAGIRRKVQSVPRPRGEAKLLAAPSRSTQLLPGNALPAGSGCAAMAAPVAKASRLRVPRPSRPCGTMPRASSAAVGVVAGGMPAARYSGVFCASTGTWDSTKATSSLKFLSFQASSFSARSPACTTRMPLSLSLVASRSSTCSQRIFSLPA